MCTHCQPCNCVETYFRSTGDLLARIFCWVSVVLITVVFAIGIISAIVHSV